MYRRYRMIAIGAATLLLALAIPVAAGQALPESQEIANGQIGPIYDDRRQGALPGSTYSMGVLHVEGHDGLQTETVVQLTPALLQIERDAILSGNDSSPSRLSSVQPPPTQHRPQELLLADSEIAFDRFGRSAAPGWGTGQPHLIGGLAAVLLGCVLVLLRPRSPRSPMGTGQGLMQGLRAWLIASRPALIDDGPR